MNIRFERQTRLDRILRLEVSDEGKRLIVSTQRLSHLLVEIVATGCSWEIEQLRKVVGEHRIGRGMPLRELRQLGRLAQSHLDATELVDKTDPQGVLPQPHMTLGHLLHLINRETAAIGHTLTEELITTVDIRLQVAEFIGGERTRARTKERIFVGFHLIKLQSQFSLSSPLTSGNIPKIPMDPVSVLGSATIQLAGQLM